MAILKNVEIHWVKCNPEQPQRFQNKADAPAKWSVQIRTSDKATKNEWEKEYGMSMKVVDDDDGIYYKTSLSRYAFSAAKGGGEDDSRPNKPVNVILANGEAIDPDTVGNGSIANISMFVKDDKSARTLKGIQVTKLIKFEPRADEDEFELTDDFEIIEDAEGNDDPY